MFGKWTYLSDSKYSMKDIEVSVAPMTRIRVLLFSLLTLSMRLDTKVKPKRAVSSSIGFRSLSWEGIGSRTFSS